MSSSLDVVLYLGSDTSDKRGKVHDYLTSLLPEQVADNPQRLIMLSGDSMYQRDGYPGSGQAGTMLIYGGILRRGHSGALLDYLDRCPSPLYGAVLILCSDYDDEAGIFRYKRVSSSGQHQFVYQGRS